MSSPLVASGWYSYWGSLSGSSTPSCCDLAVGRPLTGLAILALCRQRCQPLMQAATITVMTTPLAESFNADWQQLYCYHNCLHWAVPRFYSPWLLCLCHGLSAGIAWQEVTGLYYFNLPHSVVSRILCSFRASSESSFGVYIIQDFLQNDLVDAHFWGFLTPRSLWIFPRNLFQLE